MANRNPEQNLIDEFITHLKRHAVDGVKIDPSVSIHANCKSKKHADIEFKSKENQHWVIEAKSDDSKDRHNTVHKIFGELLKETGRTDRSNCHYAILIHKSAVLFYSRAFQLIDREKFLGFGKLIPIDTVFASDENGVSQLAWEELYDTKP